MFPVRDTSDHKGNLNAGFWILQKLEVFTCASRLAQLQLNVRTRKYFPILSAVMFERRTFESRGYCNFRRWCRNEIDQDERNNAYDSDSRSQSFEQLPTTISQHEYFPRVSVRHWKNDG